MEKTKNQKMGDVVRKEQILQIEGGQFHERILRNPNKV
jgi:hypothetical protein